MLVRTISSIEDRQFHPLRVSKAVCRPGGGVSYDNSIGTHRLEDEGRVFGGLTSRQGGVLHGEVDDIYGQALGGGLEEDPGARQILKEQVNDHPPIQSRELPDLMGLGCGHLLDRVKEEECLTILEIADGDEVIKARFNSPFRAGRRHVRHLPSGE